MSDIQKKLQSFYDNYALESSISSKELSGERISLIVNLIGKNKRVLDVGCHDGVISSLIKDQGNTVIGLDISEQAVAKTKSAGVEAYVCNLEEDVTPLSNIEKFDVIHAGEIIEHIFDTDLFVRRLGDLLKKDGELVLTTPNLASLGNRLSLLLGQSPFIIENSIEGLKAGHIRYFTKKSLTELLENNGFKVLLLTSDSLGIGKNISFPYVHTVFPGMGRVLVVKAVKI